MTTQASVHNNNNTNANIYIYNEENGQNVDPVTGEDEPHQTHSFDWQFSDKKNRTSITCNKAGTIEDLLKRSPQFKRVAGKNKGKELVIIKDRKAISSQFPCSLIENKLLTVMYVKAVSSPKKSVSRRKRPSSELVVFHVLTKGGKNVTKIMRNPALKSEVQEITVFAYKGEKVKKALQADGRFLPVIFKKNCALTNVSSDVNTEMSGLVDDLGDKTFQIKLLNKDSPPESQPSSLEEDVMLSEYPTYDSSDTAEPDNVHRSKRKRDLDGRAATKKMKLPSSEKVQTKLSSRFRDSVKQRSPVPKLSRIQNLLRKEFGQNAQLCTEVKTMKTLMKLSDSVCHVRVNGKAYGTGFLLFNNFVLTNGHVIADIYNDRNRQLSEKVTVHFSFENLNQTEGGPEEVEEVVGFDFCHDVAGRDWALLRLKFSQTLPSGLLKHFGLMPQGGGICIIGHPDGGVKKIDPCVIIPHEKRGQEVTRHYNKNKEHIQLITSRFFDNVAISAQQNAENLHYRTSFYHGASGSPVFDHHCHVVAVHTYGYIYKNIRGETESVIESGHSLSSIIENMIVQLVEREMLDVLKDLVSHCPQHQDVLTNVKKVVQSRNNVLFKNAVNNLLSRPDIPLKSLFEFFAKEEEPVPMEIDSPLRI